MVEFDHDRDEVIQRAFQAGIKAILCPAEVIETRNLQISLSLNQKYKNIIASAGMHPHQAKDFTKESFSRIKEAAEKKQIHAVGEIGLDFHYNYSPSEKQITVFRQQLNLSQQIKLPVVVHSRLAGDKISQIIQEESFTQGGVLHCFTEGWKFAHFMLEHNFYVSLSGIITFPKAHSLREVAKKIPLDRLMIETDSPYLIPVPHRGKIKRNEPMFVKETAQILARIKQISFEELASVTSKNFETCFRFEIKDF
jgi:TatD DNase family protein